MAAAKLAASSPDNFFLRMHSALSYCPPFLLSLFRRSFACITIHITQALYKDTEQVVLAIGHWRFHENRHTVYNPEAASATILNVLTNK